MLKESKGYYGRWVMVNGDHVKAEKQREMSGEKGKGKRKRRKKSGGEGVFIVFQWLKDRKELGWGTISVLPKREGSWMSEGSRGSHLPFSYGDL